MNQNALFLSQQLLVGEALKVAAHNVPDKEAFIYGSRRLTYKETLEQATHLAGWLQINGINKDDKVGCIFKNSLSFVELYLGTALSGGVFVPINFRLVPREIEYIINKSDIKILFIEEEFIEKIHPISQKLPKVQLIVVVGKNDEAMQIPTITYEQIFNSPVKYKELRMSDNDSHAIIFTSGTTGRPKGAVLTHKNFYMNAMNKLYHSPNQKEQNNSLSPALSCCCPFDPCSKLFT